MNRKPTKLARTAEPWGLHGLQQDRINPLENLIAIASDPALQRGLTDEVKVIVMQLYPEPEDTRNQYFREGSRGIMRAVLLYLAVCAPKVSSLKPLLLRKASLNESKTVAKWCRRCKLVLRAVSGSFEPLSAIAMLTRLQVAAKYLFLTMYLPQLCAKRLKGLPLGISPRRRKCSVSWSAIHTSRKIVRTGHYAR